MDTGVEASQSRGTGPASGEQPISAGFQKIALEPVLRRSRCSPGVYVEGGLSKRRGQYVQRPGRKKVWGSRRAARRLVWLELEVWM